MKVFEFHFNPKKEKTVIFDSFLYKPENAIEQELGELYIIVQLSNALPDDAQFLSILARTIKENYYIPGYLPEQGIKQALKAANDFLAGQIKNEKVNWLGNLDIAILSIKDSALNLAKAGNIKILLSQGKEITDIGQNLETQSERDEPTKIFNNIVAGNIAQIDKICVLTKDLFNFFSQEDLISVLACVSKEKEFKQIFKGKKQALSKISGIYFSAASDIQTSRFRKKFSAIRMPAIKIKMPFIGLLQKLFSPSIKKGFLLAILLCFVLSTGFLIFQKEKQAELKLARQTIEEAEAISIQAESFLIIKNEKKANLLLQEAWAIILPQVEHSAPLRDEAQHLKQSIEEKLAFLNKLEKIEDPLLSNDFKESDFGSEEIIYRSKVYSLNPEAGEIMKEGKIWGKSEKLINARAMAIDGSIWVLNKNGSIDKYYAGIWQKTLEIQVFPNIEKATKIYTSPQLPALYILEPTKNRLISADKTGQIIKQYYSDKFDNLKDFVLSEDGKQIYLLNGFKIYQIDIP